MYLSEIRPPQAFEINEIDPCGLLHAINTLRVLCL